MSTLTRYIAVTISNSYWIIIPPLPHSLFTLKFFDSTMESEDRSATN